MQVSRKGILQRNCRNIKYSDLHTLLLTLFLFALSTAGFVDFFFYFKTARLLFFIGPSDKLREIET